MTPFTDDQYDMLKEVLNMAMGRAGSDLAKILKSFVDLQVPDLEIVPVEQVVDKALEGSVFKETEPVILFGQTFSNSAFMDGESVVIFDSETRKKVGEILGCPDSDDQLEAMDFMMELSNLMVGACMNGISEQLFGQAMKFSPPELILQDIQLRTALYDRFQRSKLKWDCTLLSKINFVLKDRSFKSDVIIFISQDAIEPINNSLNRLLAEYE